MDSKFFKKANLVFDILLFNCFSIAAMVGVYIMIDARNVYISGCAYQELRNFIPEKEETEKVLREISGNAIAWITVEDTTISYPVVQGEDNLEFLSKDPEGNYSMAGSIFLDFRNQSDFTDSYNVVYGHHMPDKLMFGALDDFSEKEFFMTHRDGILSLPDRQIPFQTAAFLIVPAGCEEIFEPGYQADYPEFFRKAASIYEPEVMTGHLVALTTCAEDAEHFREVLILALEEG